MKGKFLLSVFVLLLPGSLIAQVATPTKADAALEFSRYEIFADAAYMSANQVKGSSATVGFNVGGAAKLRKWFGGTAEFGQYEAYANRYSKPTSTTFLAGPEFYIPSGSLTGIVHVMFGGQHTGGTPAGEKPDVAFAYAVGGGFEYVLTKHLSVRVSGDGIVSSFVLDPDKLGLSPQKRTNGRALAGVAYRF